MVAALAIDTDEVRLPAAVVARRAEIRSIDLFAVLGAGDVARLGFVLERDELTDDKQHHRERGGPCGSAMHAVTIARLRTNCTADDSDVVGSG